jgi:hypothetical protein
MRAARKSKFGVTILVVGLSALMALYVWRSHLETTAVHRSISLTPGKVQQDFRLNYSVYYRMGIEAERKLPHETLRCLLGIHDFFQHKAACKDIPAALKYSWRLSCDGAPIKEGSSEKIDGGAYTNDTIEAEFGSFNGKRGEMCRLELELLQDGSRLSVTNPKLHIYADFK